MIFAYRIVKARHADTSFSGEGARLAGGRWNEPGTAIVYLGGSLALAALETFIHLRQIDQAIVFVSFQVRIPASVGIESLPELPPNWRSEPPPPDTKRLGTAWAQRATTAVLRVPSVIIPSEDNYLINPQHPDFRKLLIDPPQAFSMICSSASDGIGEEANFIATNINMLV